MNDQPLASSRYLEGNFGPVNDERDDAALTVLGAIPAELEGTFVRNGPNPQFAPRVRYHWFAGDGMLHAVELRGGRARYRNRFVRTEGFERERAAGRALWKCDLGMPDFDNEHGPTRGNTANTALVFHHQKLLALWEAGPPHEIKLPSLETAGVYTFGGAINEPFTAHPKVDPRTGELLFFGYSLVGEPHLRYGEARPDGTVSFVRDIRLEKGTMIHDFVITERFAVIGVFPFPFELELAMQGQNPFVFRPELPTRWAVIERGSPTGAVRWIESEACYAYHFANAFERGEDIVIDGCPLARASVDFDNEIGADENLGAMHRWELRGDRTVSEHRIDESGCEFPKINDERMGREHRFVYCARIDRGARLADEERFGVGWTCFDLARGTSSVHLHGDGVFGGEGVFVPRVGAREENDGWLIGFVHNARTGQSELRIVDARALDREPVARVLLERRVPYGFHGLWVPSARR
jgi:carotenoid cleavage dioxygenase